MCGIVGWVDFSRDLSRERATLEAMTLAMCHRGPDDEGIWITPRAALGHRRLAVIDPVTGRQPMTAINKSGTDAVVLVHNGEIYNFREQRARLRSVGHEFITRSDTEVMLRGFIESGAKCVTEFDGMFASAFWDSGEQELTLVRDRLGIKPLYYFRYPSGLLFASEPKGIIANPLFVPRIDEDALPILLNSRLAMPGETPLRDLDEVPPGHILRFSKDKCEVSCYWKLESRPHNDSLPRTVRTVRELLEETIKRQMVSDVPISSLLSGGLDSATVAAVASREMNRRGDGPLDTFCVGFSTDAAHFRPTALRPEVDLPYAREAADAIGTRHHEVVLDTGPLIEMGRRTRQARDLPGYGHFDTSMYLLFEQVRRQATVSLSAEAADEVFGGYPWFHDQRIVWRDRFPWLGDAPRLADCLAPDVRARVKPADVEADRYRTLRARVPRLDGEVGLDARMREVLYFSLLGPLACLLDRKDRMSMAVGLEVRVPFCDHHLLEYVWNVPWSMKAFGDQPKTLLRLAIGDLLPDSVLNRPKSGYPGTHDPAYDAMILAEISRILADPASPLHDLIDRQQVRDLWTTGQTSMTWMNSAALLTPLVELEAWMREYEVALI